MSGHSHAKTVKRVKDANDAKRGKIFSKMARMISVAAKDGGDPETNSRLKQAIEQAKNFNLPKDNIERAIKKGTGELSGEALEEISYEALGPGNVSIIMEGITDNKNRALLEVKQILQKNNSKLADEGSVKWAFAHKGIITVPVTGDKETIEIKAIESGAEDTKWLKKGGEEFLEITTKPEELENVKKELENQGIKIESSELGWQSVEEIQVSEKDKVSLEKLFDDLDDSDDIQEIYSNLKI